MARRPTWDEYFLSFAALASSRSHDSETQVGCVIVGDKKILAVGYNGFCSGVDEENLPTTRPDKYPYMVHAEENAVSNMVINTSSDKIAYLTHIPCHRCAKLLWQNGIRDWRISVSENRVHSFSEEDGAVHSHLVGNGLKITWL